MHQVSRRTALVVALAATGGLPANGWSQADFPNRPVRLVIPWGAGTPADIAARIVVEQMAADLKQPVVIDNRPGATGTVALPEVLRQPADGYTLYLLNSSSLVAPVLYPKGDINFLKAFQAVGGIESSYSVLVTGVNKPYTSVADIVAAAQARPSGLTFASAGNGSPPHLMGELLKQEAKIDVTHVPYLQVGQAITDLISGRVDFMFLGSPVALQQLKGGRMRALAVASDQQKAAFAGVPTLVDAGYRQLTARSFDGILVRAGTPDHVVLRLNESLRKALALSSVREAFAQNTLEAMPSEAPAQFAEFVASESTRWISFAQKINLKVD